MSSGPLGSSKPTQAVTVGGVFNIGAPVPNDSQACALQLDVNGNLLVNIASGGSGGSNPSVGVDNAAAPTSSTQVGTQDAGGKLQAVSAANPLPITGSISATNPSVATTGLAPPTSAPEIGAIAGTAKSQRPSPTNPPRIHPTVPT